MRSERALDTDSLEKMSAAIPEESVWQSRAHELRRARLVRAMADLAAERGFADVSVTAVCARANVSRARFYDFFDSREACLLAVLDEGYRYASAAIERASSKAGDWREGARLGLAELLLFFETEPEITRVCVVESLAAGPRALKARERHVASMVQLILNDWEALTPPEPHPLTNAGVTASVLGIVQNHLLESRRESFLGLLGPLVGLALAPYLDAPAVAEDVTRATELSHALLAERESAHGQEGERFAGIPSLLLNPKAHRARESVLYLAGHPGSSNREIARAIGVTSYPQISKLLARLAQAGLMIKHAGRAGYPNAWSLTEHGTRTAEAIRGLQDDHSGHLLDTYRSDTRETLGAPLVTS